jgi:SNF2 family DNA or RNA helicase
MQVQVSTKHRLVGVPFMPDVKNLFPQAREITFNGAQHLLLQHGLTETFVLRRLGFDVPSPIESHYDWAGGNPFGVQKKTASMLSLNQRAYVLNDMGTGKTKSALWPWDYLYGNGACRKALVVAPLSTLNFTWAREIFATLPHRKCVVLHGDRDRRIERLNDPEAELFIINHDGLKVVQAEIEAKVKAGEIDVLIIDELAVYRNGKAARTKDMRKFSKLFRWVWGMTGSPIPHEPTDAWAQATIVTPNTVPKAFTHFRDDLMVKIGSNQWLYKPRPDAVEKAFSALQPAVRFTLDDVVELPDCIDRFIDVDMGPQQAKVYKDLVNSCYAAIQANEITAANAGAVMMKLLQVSCGWVYTSDGTIVSLDNDNRIKAMLDCVASTNRKVLMFVPFKHALAGVYEAMKKEGIDTAEPISGDTSSGKRNDIFNAFQSTSKYQVLPAHPQCLAHGITLTAADTIGWFAPVLSYEIYEQANRRIRRVGQAHKQQILHLQSTPVERKVYKMLQGREQVQNQLLKLFEDATSTLTF